MAELKLSIGDCIHYGAHGVCRVAGMEEKEFRGCSKTYYLLTPISEEHIRLYLPTDAEPNRVKLRKVLSAQEIYALVDQEKDTTGHWIADSKLRREVYNRTLRGGDTAELMRMVKALHSHQEELPAGKTLPMSDLELMRSAEKLLYNEFNYVLHLDKDQVLPLVLGQCQPPEKQ